MKKKKDKRNNNHSNAALLKVVRQNLMLNSIKIYRPTACIDKSNKVLYKYLGGLSLLSSLLD